MHLKSLTLRGFKSFAQATRLTFEPGITCVVGPNGTGKSNVVDALSWVMGEQGAKSLRGGKMEDVIFAGTRTRAALGRAEVKLTIDNTDGALPIDYTEVTLSRTLFRNGNSEYAINGTTCRLLDIQELLSDTGMGREMHVIVGQGQLDAVLSASPEERRGFIEEAAGVLKHRRRKERALRKLESMQANLLRLTDLTAEVRRQLGPLARQADVARRAQSIQVALRDASARLLADDVDQLRASLGSEAAAQNALAERRAALEADLSLARGHLVDVEAAAARAVPEASRAADHYFRLGAVQERLRSLGALAAERARGLGGGYRPSAAGVAGAGTAQGLEALVHRLEGELADAAGLAKQSSHQAALADQAKTEAEASFAAAEAAYTAALRSVADQRETLATLAGQVGTARSLVENREAQVAALRQTLEQATASGEEAAREFTELEQQIAGVESGEASLDQTYEKATMALDLTRDRLDALTLTQGQARGDLTASGARQEALALTLAAKDAAADLLTSGATLGAVAELIKVKPGWENALAAGLGLAATAVAVASGEQAVDQLRRLRQDQMGTAGLVIGQAQPTPAPAGPPPVGVWAASLVSATGQDAQVARAVQQLLDSVVAVDTLAQARQVIAQDGNLRAVTKDGDLLGARFAHGGSGQGPSVLELRSELAAAEAAAASAQAVIERTTFELVQAQAEVDHCVADQAAALEALTESDQRHAAVADRLGHLAAAVRSRKEAAGQAEQALAEATAQLQDEHAALATALATLEAAQAGQEMAAPDAATRDQLAEAAEAARRAAGEAQVQVKQAEAQITTLQERIAATRRAATAERAAEAQAKAKAESRAQAAALASAVGKAAAQLETQAAAATNQARAVRDQVESDQAERAAKLVELRGQIDRLQTELTNLTDHAHQEELAKAALDTKLEQVAEKAMAEWGLDLETLAKEYGPDQPIPSASDNEPATPYVREEQVKRQRKAERELRTLGKVNPLALEEHAALAERHQFLSTQLADLKASRADLMTLIKQIDQRVQQVFTQAFEDTATQFAAVFTRLFPGGEGRLVPTNEDWLETGVDIEARPAGKAVKRLSLLSGGERSLVAIAFQLAIFMARPSPFYVLDEVEAALDETNLGRLLEIVRELRSSSQIIMVTHQRRTMEVADALYGVTMRGDGVTTLISQRLREED